MRRREFIFLLGGVLGWPLPTSAQRDRIWRIGILIALREADPESKLRAEAFQARLQELGWVKGRNVQLDYHWIGGEFDRVRSSAQDLVASQPDVIVAQTTPVVSAILQVTHTIPIIFVNVADRRFLVDALASGLARCARRGQHSSATVYACCGGTDPARPSLQLRRSRLASGNW